MHVTNSKKKNIYRIGSQTTQYDLVYGSKLEITPQKKGKKKRKKEKKVHVGQFKEISKKIKKIGHQSQKAQMMNFVIPSAHQLFCFHLHAVKHDNFIRIILFSICE